MLLIQLVNKAISELILKKWYDNCRTYLECHSEDRIKIERDLKGRTLDGPFLLPHEFLFLLCNTEDRLEVIRRSHRPELVSNRGNIHNWEFINKDVGSHQVTHIHLLSQTAFTNQAPHILVTNALNKETEDKNFRIIGVKP